MKGSDKQASQGEGWKKCKDGPRCQGLFRLKSTNIFEEGSLCATSPRAALFNVGRVPAIQLNTEVPKIQDINSAQAMGVQVSIEEFKDVQRLIEEWEVREEEMSKKEGEETVKIYRRKSAEFLSKLSIFEGVGEIGSQRSMKTSDSNSDLFLTVDLGCDNDKKRRNYLQTVQSRTYGGMLLAETTANEKKNICGRPENNEL